MSGVELGIDGLTDLEVVGRGGFSVVYAATDTRFDRRVAVKVLGSLISDSDRRRFDAECRIMGRLSAHPHVVTVHSAGYTNAGNPYILMELIEGGSLAERLAATGPLAWIAALNIVRPIADALGRGHEAGIVHRDVKPENILLAGDEPRLTDFGIAYLRDATGATSTHITASWQHASPETFTGSRDERSDLYSLASTAYALITGHAPFSRPGEDSLNPLMYRLLNEAPPGIPHHLGPPELDQFLRRGLAKNPDQRHQTAAAFIHELDVVRSGSPASGIDPGAIPTVVAPGAAPPSSPEQPPTTPTVVARADTGHPFAIHPPLQPMASPASSSDPTIAGGGGPGSPAAPRPPDGFGPPVGPPREPPPHSAGPPVGPTGPGRNWWKIGLPIAVVVAILATTLAVIALDDDPAGASELVLEPISSVGQNPFSAPVVPGAPGGPSPGPVPGEAGAVLDAINTPIGALPPTDYSGVKLPTRPAGTAVNVAGSAPGLYGGTRLIDVCDREALVAFLTSDVAKGDAWASVQGISRAEIPDYVAGLTDVVLQVDTRVTNHGYRDGSPKAIDSVLQAGTAVLIDRYGVPRVRCYCGNPLLEARPLSTDRPSVTGTAWVGFDTNRAVIISAVDPVTELILDDVTSNELLVRKPGDSAALAQPTKGAGSSDKEATTTTTAVPTSTTRSAPRVITKAGSATASSVYGGNEFPASLSVDGDATTSWFSAGGGTASYSWVTDDRTAHIDTVAIVGNADHRQYPTNFGFDQVTVSVFNGDTAVYTETFDLAGTPDPNITAAPGVDGDRIVLDFSGGEDPNCGGFAELVISGTLQ